MGGELGKNVNHSDPAFGIKRFITKRKPISS